MIDIFKVEDNCFTIPWSNWKQFCIESESAKRNSTSIPQETVFRRRYNYSFKLETGISEFTTIASVRWNSTCSYLKRL